MHPNPRRILPVVVLVAIVAAGIWWWSNNGAVAAPEHLAASGTIEAIEITIAPEIAGRITDVAAGEGDHVSAGEPLVRFDDALLQAQRRQAAAGLDAARGAEAAARAAVDAAQAQLAQLQAGARPEEVRAAAQAVTAAQGRVDAAAAQLEQATSALSAAEAAGDPATLSQAEAAVRQAEAALTIAEAGLAADQARLELIQAGARPEQLDAAEAQVAAAEAQAGAAAAQVEAAEAALGVIYEQITRLVIAAPVDGVILTRVVEPGEVVLPGGNLLVMGDLQRLVLTVYVPEDRYGTIQLGQRALVTVDSFPGHAFEATVQRIADKAEFTPRNVQTAEGRKTTVFAVQLAVANPEGKLKPGMPADVVFRK